MAITELQSNNVTSGSGVSSFNFNITGSTAGSLIIVGVHNNFGSTLANTCSDGANGSYNKDNESLSASRNLDLFTFPGNAGGTLTVTVGAASSTTFRIVWAEWAGIVTSSALDQTQLGASVSSSASSGASNVTTQASELAIGLVGTVASNTGNFVATGGYTLDQEDSSPRIGLSYLILSSTGAQTATFTLSASNTWACIVATYKAATSGAVSPQCGRTIYVLP